MHQEHEWPDGKKWALAVSVDVDGESPFLWRLRNVQVRNIAEKQQRRFGPTIGVFRLIELFSRLEIPATFFVPGFIAETYPDVVGAIASGGFEVGLHGYLHEHADEITIGELRLATERSIDVLKRQSGRKRFGHRSPGWRVTDDQIDLLRDLGVMYDSSLMGSDIPYTYRGLTEIPVHWSWDDSPYFRYTGPERDSWYPPPLSDVEQVWKDECEGSRLTRSLFVLTIHPWTSGRGSRLLLLARFLDWVKAQADVWIAGLSQVSEHYRQSKSLSEA